MSFVGPVSQMGKELLRPHDIDILLSPADEAQPGRIVRVLHLGFEVRVEVELDDGRLLRVQQARAQAEELELEPGQTVYLRSRRSTQIEPTS